MNERQQVAPETKHPLIPLSDENIAFAEAMGVNPAIHETDFIFHFVDRQWAANGGRERAVKSYFNLGRYTADLAKTMLADVQKVYEVTKLDWAPRRVLDFASGYGCTARHMRHVFADSLCGTCDIHLDAVNFNKDVLGVESYISSPVPEQLKLPPQDVIFAHLVFLAHAGDHLGALAEGFGQRPGAPRRADLHHPRLCPSTSGASQA